MKKTSIVIFIIVILIGGSGFFLNAEAQISASERAALIDLYISTDGDNWKDNSGWKAPPLDVDGFAMPGTEGSWYGVTVFSHYVGVLELQSNRLNGDIPSSISNLSKMVYLNLSLCGLSSIPSEIGNLSALKTLYLLGNQLTSIPPEIGNLSKLTLLSFYINKLTSIPPEIGNLSSLITLDLDFNRLTSLPPEIGNLSNLTSLELGSNQLTSIPPEIGNLSNLITLDLYINQLTSLPPEIGKLSNLTFLPLVNNQLSSIPSEIGGLTNLKQLALDGNQLSRLPTGIGGLIALEELRLYNNKLTSLPSEIGNLSSLKYLEVNNNMLTSIPAEIGNLSNLHRLYLYYNKLPSIPPEIGNLSNLTSLDLNNNLLTSIPPEIGNLSKLNRLRLGNNQLTKIPPEIGNFPNLTFLGLSDNQLTSIPPEIGDISTLENLRFGNNQITSIPSKIWDLTDLDDIVFNSNKLKGSIPDEILYLTKLYYDGSDFRWNALYSSNSELINFLNNAQISGNWQSTQTIAPTDLSVDTQEENAIHLTWSSIPYTDNEGGYEVYFSATPGGPYALFETTEDKTVETSTVTKLKPDTQYYFILRTVTYSHPDNANTVYSDFTDEISAKTIEAVNALPIAYEQSVSTDEEDTIDIILSGYDMDFIDEISTDKSSNDNDFFAIGDDDNTPEPNAESAEGYSSAYFEIANNEFLFLYDLFASDDMPWKNGTLNKTGTVWLKFKADKIDRYQTLFSKCDYGDDRRSIHIMTTSESEIFVKIGFDGGADHVFHFSGTPLESDVWYALAVTFKQNGGHSGDPEKVYIEVRTVPDGEIVGTSYVANAFDDSDNHEISLTNAPYMIGASLNTSVYRPFGGYIDDVMIFNEKMIGDDFEQYAKGNIAGDPDCHLDFEYTPLTFSIVSQPSHGTLSGSGPDVTYSPDKDFFGNDSFTFKVNDGDTDSNTATVSIDVEPVNDAPIITGQLPLATESGVALDLTLSDLIIEDVDENYPVGFSLHVNDGSNYTVDGVQITPDNSFTGVLTVSVYVNDGSANSNTYNLNITVDIFDGCPSDPNKIEPGVCGCGVPDTDTDNDGTADCDDNCPIDPDKVSPGVCGCSTPDIDADQDGKMDCLDNCDSNLDSDGDGLGDCDENCPFDINKTEPGKCGCGIPDTDSDGDGTADCSDNCPQDPNKTSPGICGCGIEDFDANNDGVAECIDSQPVVEITSPDSDQVISVGESVEFRCDITNGNTPYTFLWDFDGGASNVPVRNPGEVVFEKAGKFVVTVSVADKNGDLSSDKVTITVNEPSGGGGGGGGGGCFINSLLH